MAIILYPNPNTRRTVEHAIASGKLILWIYDKVRTLFHNPGITSGLLPVQFAVPPTAAPHSEQTT